ncbi:MAG: hypothetical protein RL357_590 [Pseudomonadota bacterium]
MGLEPVVDLKPLLTLIAIVNPMAVVPFFIHYTQGFSDAQAKRTIRTASMSVFIVMAACALIGLQILGFFGISLASFQVGGGMLLLMSALSMLQAKPIEGKVNEQELAGTTGLHSVGVVPLAIPLLAGPATMSTVVIYAEQSQSLLQHSLLIAYAGVVAGLTYFCMRMAHPISQTLGRTGINIMTRLMGLILAALAVEVMASGLSQLFPALRA